MNNDSKKKSGRAAHGITTCAAALILISTGTAWAFTTYDGYDDVSSLNVTNAALQPRLEYTPPSSLTDDCLPLLKTIHTSPNPVSDRNQRSAGKVAALGLIFGVRYALTPPGTPIQKTNSNESMTGKVDVWQNKGSSLSGNYHPALAVSAYRTCQKELALNALR